MLHSFAPTSRALTPNVQYRQRDIQEKTAYLTRVDSSLLVAGTHHVVSDDELSAQPVTSPTRVQSYQRHTRLLQWPLAALCRHIDVDGSNGEVVVTERAYNVHVWIKYATSIQFFAHLISNKFCEKETYLVSIKIFYLDYLPF